MFFHLWLLLHFLKGLLKYVVKFAGDRVTVRWIVSFVKGVRILKRLCKDLARLASIMIRTFGNYMCRAVRGLFNHMFHEAEKMADPLNRWTGIVD